jgi:preprotein translocase subunit SecG
MAGISPLTASTVEVDLLDVGPSHVLRALAAVDENQQTGIAFAKVAGALETQLLAIIEDHRGAPGAGTLADVGHDRRDQSERDVVAHALERGGVGGSSQAAFGARSGATVLSRATTICAVLFIVGALALGIMGQRGPGSVVGGRAAPQTQQTPTSSPAAQQPPATPAPAPSPAK